MLDWIGRMGVGKLGRMRRVSRVFLGILAFLATTLGFFLSHFFRSKCGCRIEDFSKISK